MTEQSIFLAARDIASPSARAEYLDEVCRANVQLRERIEALLKADAAASGFLDSPSGVGEVTLGVRPAAADLRIRYFGDYELIEEIGRGGMGAVYKARQSRLNRIVAVKMILSGQLATDADVRRFHAEAEAAAKLDHPGIVPVFEVGMHEGHHYFSMAYVEGESLAHQIVGGLPTPRQAAELLRKVAEAVAFAHIEGVIHRDLKPANILIDKTGQPRLTDFGLAKRLASPTGVTASPGLTITGQILGTPSYMPPEQAVGQGDVGPRSDVYSLGAVLYCLLTGRPPFQSDNPLDTLMQVVQNDPVSPRLLNSAVTRDLETITLKCLEKDPARRYAMARDLIDDLDRFLRGEPIAARPAGSIERFGRWCRRNPIVATLTAGIAASLVGGAVVSLNFAEQANRRADDARVEKVRAERFLYDAHMNLAQRAWEDGKVSRVMTLLDRHQPKQKARDAGNDLRGWEWHYQNRLIRGELRSLGSGGSVVFSPEGDRLATALTGILRIVNVADGGVQTEITSSKSGVGNFESLAFHPTGKWVASTCGSPGFQFMGQPLSAGVHLWDVANGDLSRTFADSKGDGYRGVAFSPKGDRIAAGWNVGHNGALTGKVKVWDVETGEQRFSLPHGDGVSAVSFSPDGRWLVAAGYWWLKVWDASTGKPAYELNGGIVMPDRYIRPRIFYAIAFSPKGDWLAAACGNGDVERWKVSADGTFALQPPLKGRQGAVTRLAFSPDGATIAAGGDDGSVCFWDVASGAATRILRGHISAIAGIAYTPDGSRIATSDGQVKLWPAIPDGDFRPLTAHLAAVTSLAFSPDGATLASGTFQFWDPQPKKLPVATDSQKIWDMALGREIATLPDRDEIRSVAFRPGSAGRHLASTGFRKIQVWDVEHKKFILTIPVSDNRVERIVYTPDGTRLLSVTDSGEAKIWDAGTGKEIRKLCDAGNSSTSLAIKPDGKIVAVGKSFSAHTFYDVETGSKLREVPTGGACAAFSPDGSLLAADGPFLGTVKIWNVDGFEELHVLAGHTGRVWTLAFSPDGQRLATAGEDAVIKIWDVVSGQEVRTLSGHAGMVRAIAFSPDGHWLATGGDDKIIRLWNAQPLTVPPAMQEAIAIARHLKGQNWSQRQSLDWLDQNRTLSNEVREKTKLLVK